MYKNTTLQILLDVLLVKILLIALKLKKHSLFVVLIGIIVKTFLTAVKIKKYYVFDFTIVTVKIHLRSV